jgi:hypothetical protein
MNTAQRIYESAARLSAQLIGMPKAYQPHPDTYRVDFGTVIIETSKFQNDNFVVRQIYPVAQIFTFERIKFVLDNIKIVYHYKPLKK